MVEAANTVAVAVAVGEIDIENNINKAASARILLTVWRKSLLMNCNGFTVYDSTGNLVFRVDDYCVSNLSNKVLLMDAAGKALITIRRKVLAFIYIIIIIIYFFKVIVKSDIKYWCMRIFLLNYYGVYETFFAQLLWRYI